MGKIRRDPAKVELAKAIIAEYQPKTADDLQEALRDLFGPMTEAMLVGELDAHLGYPSNDKGPKEGDNRRNGYTRKTVRTAAGSTRISVPRDRDGSFEPLLVPKGERDLSGVEERVVAMYARGMSQRDIADTVREIYGFSISADTVSAITDRVLEECALWSSRPLEPLYAFAFVDCMWVSVRRDRRARRAAVYTILAYDVEGRKDVLGLWFGDGEGAARWAQVFDELRARGVEDILFLSCDGVGGLADGLRAVFPETVVQRCVVHLVRNSTRFVPSADMKAFCADIRGVYGAPSLEAARSRFEAFRSEWSRYPGAVRVWERSFDQVEQLFDYGASVRRVMYTTNAVESLNSSLRKVTKRGSFPDEDGAMKLLYLRVRELYRKWGEGCHMSHWSKVRNEILCDPDMARRVEPYM